MDKGVDVLLAPSAEVEDDDISDGKSCVLILAVFAVEVGIGLEVISAAGMGLVASEWADVSESALTKLPFSIETGLVDTVVVDVVIVGTVVNAGGADGIV